MNISAIDLFCGAGGLTHGLLKSDLKVVGGFDIEPRCQYAYETNNDVKFYCGDVDKLESEKLLELFVKDDMKLLAGCAPCQPFSRYNSKNSSKIKENSKWPLLYSFLRLVKEIEPEFVTMENVPGIVRYEVYTDFVEGLRQSGYSIWADKVYCPDFGIPQKRKRHVLLASKLGNISMIETTHSKDEYPTVRDTISGFPRLEAGEHSDDPLHSAAKLSALNLNRIRHSIPGGTWKDWPKNLRAKCHKKSSGSTFQSVYGRMKWDEPSPTITTQCFGFGNGRFGHPFQDRAITLREAAAFQTFPKTYKFVEPNESYRRLDVGQMIGNAVPVRLGEVIGMAFKEHLRSL